MEPIKRVSTETIGANVGKLVRCVGQVKSFGEVTMRFVFKCIFEGTLQLQVTGPSPTPYTVNFEDPSETFETGSFVEVIATVRQTGKETYELDHSPEFAAINLSEDPTFGIFPLFTTLSLHFLHFCCCGFLIKCSSSLNL